MKRMAGVRRSKNFFALSISVERVTQTDSGGNGWNIFVSS